MCQPGSEQTLANTPSSHDKERRRKRRRKKEGFFFLQNWARDKPHLSQWETDCRKRKKNERNGFITGGYATRPN